MHVKFYLGNLLRTIAWETASQIALRNCFEEVREEPGYIGFFAEERHVVKHKTITVNLQTSQKNLMILVLFYVWEDARVWAH